MCLAYSKMRDLDKELYSPEEAKVAVYLVDLTGIGGGDDPVGFLNASHAELVRRRVFLREKYPEIFHEIAFGCSEDMQTAAPASDGEKHRSE